ncbi:MAG: hypothetical protein ABI947_08935 [Chloroflexota bacterium]
MTLQDIVREARALSIDERRELIKLLVDTLADPEIGKLPQTKRSLTELAGLGAEIWEGIDAQKYVDQLRSEWDHRP